MEALFRQIAVQQYEASLATIQRCVTDCPDELWQSPVVNHPFSQSIFHALFFADLYLGQSVEDQPRQAFHRQHAAVFGDYEQLEDRIPHGTYDKPFIHAYIRHCCDKATEVLASEDEARWQQLSGFPWLNIRRGEVHIYNIRHLQHHAGQVIAKLRSEAGRDMPWIKSGWPDQDVKSG